MAEGRQVNEVINKSITRTTLPQAEVFHFKLLRNFPYL